MSKQLVSGRSHGRQGLGVVAALILLMMAAIGCGKAPQAPAKPTPSPTPPPGATATPLMGEAFKASFATTSTVFTALSKRPVPWPTPALQFGAADLAFIPLHERTGQHFSASWELRHYARAALESLLAPYVACTVRDDFSADQQMSRSPVSFSTEPLLSEVLQLSQPLGARFVVLPILRKTDGGEFEAAIQIVDVAKGAVAGTKTVRRKVAAPTPAEAQQALLDAALAAGELLTQTLGGKWSLPPAGKPTPSGSQAVLADAEARLRRWELSATRGALELAAMAIKNEPADGRAWALAARCYARLALDTANYPARFHREARLRAIVAADLARRFAPQDPNVRFAAAEALHANFRHGEATRLLDAVSSNSKHGRLAFVLRAAMRGEPVDVARIAPPDSAGSGVAPEVYLAARANTVAGDTSASLEVFGRLRQKEPRNVLLAARLAAAIANGSGIQNLLAAGADHATLAVCEAFAQLLPAAWTLDAEGMKIAAAAVRDLRAIAGPTVPETLEGRENTAAFQKALGDVADAGRGSPALAGILSLSPDNTLFRLLRAYGKFETALARHLMEQPPKSRSPLGLSLLDTARLYDRLILEGLGSMHEALRRWGAADEGKRLADEIAKDFPADEAGQLLAGLFYTRTPYFSPQVVTRHFDQAKYLWPYYVPERMGRQRWAISEETPESAGQGFKAIADCDVFNAALVEQIVGNLWELRQWDDAAELVDRLLQDNPDRLDLRDRRLRLERAASGRQLTKAAIAKLAADFRTRTDIDETVCDLYYTAGFAPEAEVAARRLLAKDPGNQSAFYDLVELLRLQGKLDESDRLVEAYVARHTSLAGNAALTDAASYYFDRRDYDRAARFLSDQWDALDSWQGNTILLMGKLKGVRGDLAGARAEFERFYTRYNNSDGLSQKAELEALRGNWNEVNKQADRVLATDPASLVGFWWKALDALRKGDLAEGEKMAFGGRVVLAHWAPAYYHLALWRYLAGNFKGAIQAAEEGRKYVKGPQDRDLDWIDFRARLAVPDPPGAKALLDRMKLFSPLDPSTLCCDALWRLEHQDPAGARQCLEPPLRYNPRDPFAQLVHARVLLAEGKASEAVAELQYATGHLQRIWQGVELYCWLCQALQAAGRPDEAKKAYDQLIAICPAGYWPVKAKSGAGK